MKISVVGYNNYVKDNKVRGVNIYGVEHTEMAGGCGVRTFSEYVSSDKIFCSFDVGDIICIEFTQYKSKDGYRSYISAVRKEEDE